MLFTESNEWRHTGLCKCIYLDKQRTREWIIDGEVGERVWANYYGADVWFVWGVEWGGFRQGCSERKAPSLCCKRGAQLIISIRLDAHTHAQAYSDREQVEKNRICV